MAAGTYLVARGSHRIGDRFYAPGEIITTDELAPGSAKELVEIGELIWQGPGPFPAHRTAPVVVIDEPPPPPRPAPARVVQSATLEPGTVEITLPPLPDGGLEPVPPAAPIRRGAGRKPAAAESTWAASPPAPPTS